MWRSFVNLCKADENNAEAKQKQNNVLYNKNGCPPIEETQKAPFVTLVSALK